MCLWSMGQEDEFYDEKLNNLKYGGSIWHILSQACGVRLRMEWSSLVHRGAEEGNHLQSVGDATTAGQHRFSLGYRKRRPAEGMQCLDSLAIGSQQYRVHARANAGYSECTNAVPASQVLDLGREGHEWFRHSFIGSQGAEYATATDGRWGRWYSIANYM